jgi:hypothetical protein
MSVLSSFGFSIKDEDHDFRLLYFGYQNYTCRVKRSTKPLSEVYSLLLRLLKWVYRDIMTPVFVPVVSLIKLGY